MRFEEHGAERVAGALTAEEVAMVAAALSGLPAGRAGVRVAGIAALRPLLATDGAVGRLAAERLGAGARAVRAVLFDKGPR
ncbi:MAG TPA: hypothetical protein VD929_03155 [Caulobacteraceae bacterium]|nr:hypothetical protein [Caulobacteraceae bacterium]